MNIFIFILILVLHTKAKIYSRLKREKIYEPHVFASCFEDIGCIDFTEKWFHEKYRPKNLEPLDRHTIRTEFLLMKNPKNITRDLVYDIMSLKRETIDVAGFKKGTCSIFVIHDFTSNGYTGWVKHLVVALLRKTDCNVISVDWQAGAEPPLLQAISNARVVALESKIFISLLKSCFNQSPDNLHLIGHGVGAHIAGYIGKGISGIQRITGLDPTGPYFANMPKEVHLDVDDAKYVEILHTDSFNHRSQGTKVPMGHADFMINDAEHQPGCNDSSHMPSFKSLDRDSLQLGKILPACSHKRSFKYYIEALEEDDCQFIAIKCSSYKNFLDGHCNTCNSGNNSCATFGLKVPSTSTKNNTFYLLTNSKKPFCLVSYSVNVTVMTDNVSREVEGYFEMILVDEGNQVTNASNNIQKPRVKKFDSGYTYNFIFYAMPPCLNKIKEAKVKWTYKSKKICIMCEKSIAVKDISIQRMTLKPEAKVFVNFICPIKKHGELKTGDYVQFETCESLYGEDYAKNRKQKPLDQVKFAQAAFIANANAANISHQCEMAEGKPESSKLESSTPESSKPTTLVTKENVIRATASPSNAISMLDEDQIGFPKKQIRRARPHANKRRAVECCVNKKPDNKEDKDLKSFDDCFDANSTNSEVETTTHLEDCGL